MFFPAQVTIYPYNSTDAHHKVTYGTPVTQSCKYSQVLKTLKDSNGTEIITTGWLMFPPNISISEKDKIVLPDGKTSKIVKLQRIKNHVNVDMWSIVYTGEA